MVRTPLSLKGRALRLLAQREHSRAELQTKLARHVQEGENLAAVLDELAAKGFIDENRVAQSLVHRRAPRLGTARLVQEMRSKGLSDALVRETAEQLRATEVSRAHEVWLRRFGGQAAQTPQEHAKQVRFLASRGFAAEAIRRAMKSGQNDDD